MKRFAFMALLAFATQSQAGTLKVTSKALKEGATVPDVHVFNGFGCSGGNSSPDLSWEGAPKETKSFAVSCYDPDAPTGSGFWHWTAFNIPATTHSLAQGASLSKNIPAGTIEGRTDFGKAGYGGPCPPAGDKPHRYIFKVFALKDTIPLDSEAPAAMVGFYTNQLKLAEGQITAIYSRKK